MTDLARQAGRQLEHAVSLEARVQALEVQVQALKANVAAVTAQCTGMTQILAAVQTAFTQCGPTRQWFEDQVSKAVQNQLRIQGDAGALCRAVASSLRIVVPVANTTTIGRVTVVTGISLRTMTIAEATQRAGG